MGIHFVFFPLIYVIIFIVAVFGNCMFVIAVSRNTKLHSSVFIFLANQSISDLLFINVTLFSVVEFIMQTWIFGDIFCRINGFMLEICYTVSILSLCAVAVERYLLICNVNNTKKTTQWCVKASALIWLISGVLCCPGLYGYTANHQPTYDVGVNASTNGFRATENITTRSVRFQCSARYWSKTVYITYCCIHGAIVYLIPILIMLFTHHFIAKALKKQKITQHYEDDTFGESRSTWNEDKTMRQRRHKLAMSKMSRNLKVIKLLITITVTFVVIWSPFMMMRVVRKMVFVPHTVWTAVQGLILTSTNTNFFITLKMSAEFKKTIQLLMKCADEKVDRRNYSNAFNRLYVCSITSQV